MMSGKEKINIEIENVVNSILRGMDYKIEKYKKAVLEESTNYDSIRSLVEKIEILNMHRSELEYYKNEILNGQYGRMYYLIKLLDQEE